MEILTKEETLKLVSTLQERLNSLEQELAQVKCQQTQQSGRMIKMKQVQQILGLSWEEVRYRMEKGVIQYSNKGRHYIFDSTHIQYLQQNPHLLELRNEYQHGHKYPLKSLHT